MIHLNETPETPDYVPGPPRAWDESKCCPAECEACDVPANVVLGSE